MLRTVRVTNGIIIAAAGYSALLLIFALAKGVGLYYILGIAILLCGLVASLKLSVTFRVNVAVLLVSVAVSLFAAELVLTAVPNLGETRFEAKERAIAAASEEGIPFDTRTRRQVVDDLRATGVHAYPLVRPRFFGEEGLEINGEEIFPLAGIANTTTVFCNETGEYAVYGSDEHGFHNPKGIWGQAEIDVVAIGDSFTQGACVKSEENAVAHIRTIYNNTLNLGMIATGPPPGVGDLKGVFRQLEAAESSLVVLRDQ